MDNIAKFCIKHKVTTLMAVIMISIFGVVFTTQLQMALLPDMEAPAALVMCYYNGASPSDMEELVTRPLESAIMSVSGVDGVSSTSSDGVSQLQITYVDGTDLDIAATKLREQFDRLSLPDGAMDPIIVNINIGDLMPSAMIALQGEDLASVQAQAEDHQTAQQHISTPAGLVPSAVIGRALTSGGNEPHSIERIVAFFQKGPTGSAAVSFMEKEFGAGGKGVTIGGQEYSLWFNSEGFRIAPGRSAFGPGSTLVTWVNAAAMASNLLRDGTFATQDKIDVAPDNEVRELLTGFSVAKAFPVC